MSDLEQIINQEFENRSSLKPETASQEIQDSVNKVIAGLDSGIYRVSEKINGEWVVNQWVKKAVLLYFALNNNHVIAGGNTNYYDKVPTKFTE